MAGTSYPRMDRVRAFRARFLFWRVRDSRQRWLARAVYALPDLPSQVFHLKREEGLDHVAIARRLGLSQKDVMQQMARAMFLITVSIGRQERAAARWQRFWSWARYRGE